MMLYNFKGYNQPNSGYGKYHNILPDCYKKKQESE